MKKLKFLFSKLTLIDYIAAIVICGIFIFIFFFLRRGNTTVAIKVKVTSVNNQYSQSFVEGDQELDELGRASSTITKVKTLYVSNDSPSTYLSLNVKAVYSPLKKQYTLKGKPIIYGEEYSFTFSNVKFDAVVVDFPGYRTSEPFIEKKIMVKTMMKDDSRNFSDTYGVPPYLISAVKVGDTVKDRDGKIVAEIKNMTISPAKRTVLDANGKPYVINDPYLKDAVLDLEVSIKETPTKKFYQDYLVVEVGSPLPLPFKNIVLYPIVTEIIE